ncbi:hypothetical protein D3C81_257780 [compost metagenome]
MHNFCRFCGVFVIFRSVFLNFGKYKFFKKQSPKIKVCQCNLKNQSNIKKEYFL